MSSQNGWRWCYLCEGLFFSGNTSQGVCAGNGGAAHNTDNSAWNFAALLGDGIAGRQDGWRWCRKCEGFFFSGNPGSACPAGSGHDDTGSGHYALQLGDSVPGTQGHWRWCRKCQGLFNAGNSSQGVCPKGGAHDNTGSGAYGVAWQNPTSSFDTAASNSPLSISIGGSPADANIAVSSTHVCLTARGAFACYTKDGALVSLGTGFAARPYTAKEFFEASGISTIISATNDTNYTKDGRVVFDSFRQRFFMVFQTREKLARLLIAVSKSQNPADGWWTYADDVGTPAESGHDYQRIGVNGTHLLVSDNMQAPGGVFTRSWHLMYTAANLAAGTPYTRGDWWDTKAQNAVPCVHDSYTTDAYWVHRDDDSHASVWAVRDGKVTTHQFTIQTSSGAMNGAQPKLPGTLGVVDYGSVIGRDMQNARYRDGKIVFVSNDGHTWSGQPGPNSVIRLVRIDVSKFFDAAAAITVEIDRIYGRANADDAAGSMFDYGWPAVAANANGDIVVGTVRSNSKVFPELRASIWFKGQADISSSTLIAASSSSLTSFHMAGACPDPSSDGVYLAQQWNDTTSPEAWRMRVVKMLDYPA